MHNTIRDIPYQYQQSFLTKCQGILLRYYPQHSFGVVTYASLLLFGFYIGIDDSAIISWLSSYNNRDLYDILDIVASL